MAKLIALQGQPNFRDLGGLVTADGRVIKPGVIYRSGELSNLSNDDVSKLERLGIKTVIDFRSDQELQSRGPDRLPSGAVHHHVAIDFGDLSEVIWRGFSEGDFSGIPKDMLTQLNKHNFMCSTEQYATLLKTIISHDGLPLVFHCTHGKDRAGIAAAILLLDLGIPKVDVIKNYLASNTYRAEANRQMLEDLRLKQAEKHGVLPTQIDTSPLEVIYYLKASYFEEAFKLLIEEYQNFNNYLTQGLGLHLDELDKLQYSLLTPA
jgi:protein-tyrosine phosphatase